MNCLIQGMHQHIIFFQDYLVLVREKQIVSSVSKQSDKTNHLLKTWQMQKLYELETGKYGYLLFGARIQISNTLKKFHLLVNNDLIQLFKIEEIAWEQWKSEDS